MKNATPQRTVTISLSSRHAEEAQVSYSYWSPNDGITRTATPICDLYSRQASNTLFVLDYQATQNGWTMIGTSPNPAGAPSLAYKMGPENTSLMTQFPDLSHEEQFNFYIIYHNVLNGQTLQVDPQEGNIPR